jgi:hypothetical protein
MKSTFLTFLLLLIICSTVLSQQQGICGKVVWLEGNQMPGPGAKPTKPAGIVREVYIYEAVTTQQCTEENGFYKNIKTPLVAKVKSRKDGSFKVKLKPGIYSVFVKEQEGLWANLFDGEGRINPITVSDKNWTTIVFEVNYKAAF